MPNKITDAAGKIVDLLDAFTSDERKRAVAAAFAILGEPDVSSTVGLAVSKAARSGVSEAETSDIDVSPLGLSWIKKNNLTRDQLEEAFHIETGKVTLILGKAIGKSRREQTVNTYILTGAAALLATGSAHFSDETARQNSVKIGCYDSPNHGKYMNEFGNRITGSKNAGWTLTAPGLTAAATLLKPRSGDGE